MNRTRSFIKRKLKTFPKHAAQYSIVQCIDILRLGLLLEPRNANFNYYLAYFYAVAGKPAQSLIYVRRALKYGFRPVKKITHASAFRTVRALKACTEVFDKYL